MQKRAGCTGGRTDHLYTDRMVTVRGSGSGIWTVVTLLPETIVIKFYLKSFKALNLLTLM